MVSTPEFWVFIAFILFLGMAGKKMAVSLNQLINGHRQKISQRIEEVERLHDEALSLLESYKKKHHDSIEQAAKIMAFAEKDALDFKKTSEEEFEKFMAQKEKAFLERLAIENEEAKSKLRKEAAEEALALVEHFLARNPEEKKKLMETSLKEISTLASSLSAE